MAQREDEDRGFDQAARDFDRLGRHLWQPIGRETVRRTEPRTGERVLDACCGTGASAIPAAERVGRDGAVDAVDVSEPLLERLRGNGAHLPSLRAHRADITTWEAGDYDLVQCVLGVFFLPDMAAGARHLIARARRGGRVCFTIWRRGAMVDAGRRLQGALERVTGIAAGERSGHLVDRVDEPDAFADWLRELGLEQVRVTEAPLTLPVSEEIAWLVVTGSGFVAALNGLDDAQIDRVRVEYLRSFREDGVEALDATTLIGVGTRA